MDNEKDALGIALLAGRTPERLTEVIFSQNQHKTIWRAMKAVEAKDQELDLVTLTHQLQDTNELDEAGGVPYLIGLAEGVPNPKPPVEIHGDRVTVDALIIWMEQAARERGDDITDKLSDIRAWRDTLLN